MTDKLIKEIYGTYVEWKESRDEYRDFLDQYVEMIVLEKPQNTHENYFAYWESLKKKGGNIFFEDFEDGV